MQQMEEKHEKTPEDLAAIEELMKAWNLEEDS